MKLRYLISSCKPDFNCSCLFYENFHNTFHGPFYNYSCLLYSTSSFPRSYVTCTAGQIPIICTSISTMTELPEAGSKLIRMLLQRVAPYFFIRKILYQAYDVYFAFQTEHKKHVHHIHIMNKLIMSIYIYIYIYIYIHASYIHTYTHT